MPTLIAIENLEVRRGGQNILSVDGLTIDSGEVLAVVGPNGAGKSTLLLALAGLIQVERGSLRFGGEILNKRENLAYRRRIGLVLQDPLLMDANVFDNIAAGLRFRGVERAQVESRVRQWMERLGIAHLRARRSATLSGGEAQRAALARALVLQPELLLLDEPFSALDAPTRSALLEDLQALLAETRQTAVFVTHDLNEALLLGHRVAVLLKGELRQVGPPEQVFSAPADAEVAAFVGVETILSGQVRAAHDGLMQIVVDGWEAEAVGDLAVGRGVFLCLRPEDFTLWMDDFKDGDKLSSARNRLRGKVVRLTPQGPLARVQVDCGVLITALITRASAVEMALQPGSQVGVSFKASAAHVIAR